MSKSSTGTSGNTTASNSGEASGKKVGLHQPSNDNQIADRLNNVDLESRGAQVHDHLGDKRGNGVAGYDDSINHDADERYTHPERAAATGTDTKQG